MVGGGGGGGKGLEAVEIRRCGAGVASPKGRSEADCCCGMGCAPGMILDKCCTLIEGL